MDELLMNWSMDENVEEWMDERMDENVEEWMDERMND